MSAYHRGFTAKRLSRKGASGERTGQEHPRRERSPDQDDDSSNGDRDGSCPAAHLADQITNITTSRKRGLIEAITDSMEATHKKHKEYVPFLFLMQSFTNFLSDKLRSPY
jgi:hypothetical protein